MPNRRRRRTAFFEEAVCNMCALVQVTGYLWPIVKPTRTLQRARRGGDRCATKQATTCQLWWDGRADGEDPTAPGFITSDHHDDGTLRPDPCGQPSRAGL